MSKNFFDLSKPQNSIWLTEQYLSGTAINTIGGCATINTKIDFNLLNTAIQNLIKYNDTIRIRLCIKNNKVKQYIDDYAPVDIPLYNFKNTEELRSWATIAASTPFDLFTEPLYRFFIYKFKDGTGGFSIFAHHIVTDAWSYTKLVDRIINIYNSLVNNTPMEYNFPSYSDFLASEQEYLASPKFKKDQEYWNSIYCTIPEVATIPSQELEQSFTISFDASRENFVLDETIMKSINSFCKKNKISVFNLFMAVLSVYTANMCNLTDFTIGTPLLNRTNFNEKNTIGMFVSSLPFRVSINPDISFIDFCHNISIESMSLLRHQKYPYEYLLTSIRGQNNNVPNLYDIALSYQNSRSTTTSQMNYSMEWFSNNKCANSLDIHIHDLNDNGKLIVSYDYQLNKYTKQDILNMHNRFLHIIKQITKNSDILVKDIQIIDENERNLLLNTFNPDLSLEKFDKNIIEIFESYAKTIPNKTAIVFDGKSMTYSELNNYANALANQLLNKNVKPGDCVGIYLDKSLEIIVAILAILKINAIYMPIDIAYPKKRLDYILENSKTNLIITSSNFRKDLNYKINYINIDLQNPYYKSNFDNMNFRISADSTAYVLYTSGSTGNPKGVMVTHKGVVRLVKDTNYMKLNSNDKVLQAGSFVFDASTFEIWTALLNGLELHLLKKDDLLSPDFFEEYINKNNVNVMLLTTALFNKFCEENASMFSNVKYLLTGGEAISVKHAIMAKHSNPNLKLINAYGPTENAVISTCYPVNDIPSNNIPIGKPISGSTCYVVSKLGNLLPLNIPGELWVGGAGVANGYINNEALTNEVFIKNPFADGMLYKTGDLVKISNDGNIHFISRIDNQIKVRGFRIELNEITKCISNYNSIKEVFTTISNVNGENLICTYFSAKEEISIDDLRNYLKTYLPIYMIPACFVQVDNLPLNINGKVDKKALPAPYINVSNIDKLVEPKDDLEASILEILSNLLHLDKISMDSAFLNIGGDSLLAINFSLDIYNKFGIKISVQDILEAKNIIEIANIVRKHSDKKEEIPVIKASTSKNILPISSAQRRIFYSHAILGEDNIVYNVSGGFLVNKVLDENKIKDSINLLINRHVSFRTSFEFVDDEIMQIIKPNVQINIPVYNNTEAEIEGLVNNFPTHFNLKNCPLIRVSIHYIDNAKTLILIDSHHIIIDGTSFNIFIKEFCDLYNKNKLDITNSIDYTDYTIWENSYINSDKIKPSEDFWLEQFEGKEISTLNLPFDYTRPTSKSYKGAKIQKQISEDTFKKLDSLAKDLGISTYMLLLSLFYILLNKYTGQAEITIGSPIANRSLKDFQNVIGMFVNNIVLKININNNTSFKAFISQVKQTVLSAIEHADYPYDLLVKKLKLNSSENRNPLFDVLFTYQNMGDSLPTIDDMPINIIPANINIAKFDISLEVIPDNQTINLEYSTDLFKNETMDAFLTHYLNILQNVLISVDSKLKDISILSKEEENTLLHSFNNNTSKYNLDTPVISLIEHYAASKPNNTAVRFNDEFLSYKDLNNKVNQLARFLRTLGVKKGDIVPICLDKNLDFICAILAIQKLGAAYLPMHPDYPAARISYIMKNSGAKFIITSKSMKSAEVINLDNVDLSKYSTNNIGIPVKGSDLAYVIYTSGSTGTPKGIKLTHSNLLNFIHSFNDCFNNKFSAKDNCLSVCNIAFDVSVCEIFVPFAFGACLVLYPKNTLTDIPLLYDTIANNNVTFAYIPPSLLPDVYSYMHEHSTLTSINKLLVGVEPIKNKVLNDFYTINPDIEIVNGYGPSETTICCTFYKHSKINNPNSIVPIGMPVNNNDIYILDDFMNLQPIGITGEIYVSGNNVSQGYLNNEDLTNKAFVPNPFVPGTIMYKTGDKAKWNVDGTITFMGRNDNQIKYKGFRIELDEISNAAKGIPEIKNAITLLQEVDGNKHLCLYIATSKSFTKNEILENLNLVLPFYMIPSYVIFMENLPITLNGKLDKKALPKPSAMDIINDNDVIIAPTNKKEQILLKIFKKVLGFDKIGITSNFFENGGDSLSAMKMQVEALNYGLHISYGDIFTYPTVQKLANLEYTNSEENTSATEEDFSKYNEFLSHNVITENMDLEYTSMGNILLTGVTGFLGAHILDSFMQNEEGNIYCLVRPKGKMSPKKRLISTLSYYFGDKYLDEIDKRIFVINGDISEFNLGLDESEFLSLGNKVNTVVHSAALSKHFGDSNKFNTSNIKGTQKVIDFCEKFKLRLVHISTMSVSGNVFADASNVENNFNDKVNYNETNFYIGQNLDNLYIKTKFESEHIVLEAIQNGLEAYIMRIGNLTNRFSDGKFQHNFSENAFANRFKSIFQIKCIPDYLLDLYTEFTPVDYCADAIIKLSTHYNKNYTIFHIFNDNHITLNRLYDTFKTYGINLKVKTNEQFIKYAKELLQNPDKKKYLDGIINDLDKNYKLEYDSNIMLKSDFTKYVLSLLGFNWPYINDEYIYKYLKFFKDTGYFDINLK
ncbi:MAG: amino acid adenylation domain-containing protein [Clostridia bacterium]|nr:amino acid adenylation domain-containing protein [Clostridia bacterium]